MKNKREIGNALEDWFVEQMKVIEPNCRRTKNSGASTELEDILSEFVLVQCKVDNVHDNIIIKKMDWDKLFKAIPIDSKRLPVFVNQQKTGIKTITLLGTDFFRLVYKLFKTTGGEL